MSDPMRIPDAEFYREPVRYEWTEGVAYAMSQPSSDHQILQHELTQQLKTYFKDKKCRVIPAPFGVNLTEFVKSQRKTLYQPDISVVCDPAKLDRRTGTYYGAPALIVEVGSPSTLDKDLHEKYLAYELAGVSEYLVVIDQYTVCRYTLKDGRYERTLYEAGEDKNVSIPVDTFPGLALELRDDWFWFEQGTAG